MKEEEARKFTEDQVEAAKLAREILEKEEPNFSYDALNFALSYHISFSLGPIPSVDTIIKTATTFKTFLQDK